MINYIGGGPCEIPMPSEEDFKIANQQPLCKVTGIRGGLDSDEMAVENAMCVLCNCFRHTIIKLV